MNLKREKLLLSTMGIEYSYLLDDYLEDERVAFIAAEMETLRQMAAIYDGSEYARSSDDE